MNCLSFEKMKQTIYSIIAILTLMISCTKKHQLENQPRLNLSFEELPDTIKYYYLKSIEPKKVIDEKGDTLTIYGGETQFLCLNPKNNKCDYEIDWFISFVDEHLFYVDKYILTMEHNSNSINDPYIIFNNQFYFRITRNLYNQKEVKEAKYGKFDLEKILSE